ncbi:alkaline phosphatase D family protein, partial [Mycobacterium arosiense]|uniref:alkaline phosphatase D family protein n=1 Tax=Mycobacterium arosiense TaxID=425468 RepID=UPI001B806E39
YRRLPWGRLAQLHLLDDRQYRALQACRKPGATNAGGMRPADCAELADPTRSPACWALPKSNGWTLAWPQMRSTTTPAG